VKFSAPDEWVTNAALTKNIIPRITIVFFTIIKSSFQIFQKFS